MSTDELSAKHSSEDLLLLAARAFEKIRLMRPRLHCLTNTAAHDLTANGLVALGAVPSLSHDPQELTEFARSAAAALVNLGTLTELRIEAARRLVSVMSERQRPVVIDPVFADTVERRAVLARELLRKGVSVLRVNERELLGLAETTDRTIALRELTAMTRVVAVTGAVDVIATASREAEVFNGTPRLGDVSATGCLGAAVTAAFLAVESDPFVSALGAAVVMGVAGEKAAHQSSGPGSFRVALVDALGNLTPDDLLKEGRIA
ncbi:MAG: hydroxyethylthiazole kinase [Hyphomicrobiaceae bacterium]|nr:hydroxyethylthiazole kinase [Hyphomicrobiaceae bacterium]